MANSKFVGIQVSPISFVDEGIENVLDTLQGRAGVNVLMIGTVSWLGLKAGRSISYKLDGWPDHGVGEPIDMKGGAYFEPHPEYYQHTAIKEFRAQDEITRGFDVLAEVIPAAKARGMRVMPELMEPLFKYAGHGSVNNVAIANMPQYLEVDVYGRYGSEPCTNNPDYRRWWHSLIEDQCRSYGIDGIMWCNERRSPLDQMISGQAPGCFCEHCRREAMSRGIDPEPVRKAMLVVWEYFQAARAGSKFVDGALIEFLPRAARQSRDPALGALLARTQQGPGPGAVWAGQVVQSRPGVWAQHLEPQPLQPLPQGAVALGRADALCRLGQADHLPAPVGAGLHEGDGRLPQDLPRATSRPQEVTPLMYKLLGLQEAPWDNLMAAGMDPDTYVYGQCADAVRGVAGKIPVYMGIGVDAPRVQPDQARCTPDIVYRSVLATYRAGGQGVIFAPNYASMSLANLDGAARALTELGLMA